MLWIPAERLIAIVDANTTVYAGKDGTAASRRLSELRSGRQGFVSLDTADRILTELDLHHWFHIPKDQGGLADIYVDGVQYGAPNRLRLADGSRTNRKYETEEERQAARKATYRAAYERRRLRRAA